MRRAKRGAQALSMGKWPFGIKQRKNAMAEIALDSSRVQCAIKYLACTVVVIESFDLV